MEVSHLVLVAVSGAPVAVVTGGYLAAASATVAVVNLLPGAPLGGGRVSERIEAHPAGSAEPRRPRVSR